MRKKQVYVLFYCFAFYVRNATLKESKGDGGRDRENII